MAAVVRWLGGVGKWVCEHQGSVAVGLEAAGNGGTTCVHRVVEAAQEKRTGGKGSRSHQRSPVAILQGKGKEGGLLVSLGRRARRRRAPQLEKVVSDGDVFEELKSAA
ncbi:hypothetical protein OsI_12146 [Oryza sativa Indica Group]|uniref:Uncharacterized protein n=1 Tax=Oryza sativa subsp. indica TaxID=39946 RepID=A2XI87_ORYSI|nr:hypothetical protein OsI_12146 [Oryza sativa Indica Group]